MEQNQPRHRIAALWRDGMNLKSLGLAARGARRREGMNLKGRGVAARGASSFDPGEVCASG